MHTISFGWLMGKISEDQELCVHNISIGWQMGKISEDQE